MSDVRRLNLEQVTQKEISVVSVDEYKLGAQGMQELESVLPRLMSYGFWTPEFQAWSPLIRTYLTSGVNPDLASIWLPRISSKFRVLGPARGPASKVFTALQYMNRVPSTEAFADCNWQEIVEFYNLIPKYIDNQKIIYSYLFSKANYLELFHAMCQCSEYEGYSAYLMEAIYLYRHCMLGSNPSTQTDREILLAQIENWVSRFSSVFEAAASILPSNRSVYAWYTRDVKDIICNTWRTALDNTYNRSIITRSDVARMPIWLSEQITKYLQSLPCVLNIPVDGQFVFDAIEYAFTPDITLADPGMIYAFCIPRDYVKSLFETLSEFYWSLRDGRFIPYLISRVEAQYTSGKQDAEKTPDEYRRELLFRGFPVEGL